ncbi:hypothetical protein [Amycolatopsis sp. NPDC059657]|uniref:hypothetical protein n=1 Tax=Amycolatopsis sp. NPDC059657 TaxID=3346899 RepID=UPI00367332FB
MTQSLTYAPPAHTANPELDARRREVRPVVAVLVAVGSVLAAEDAAINDMTAHLPPSPATSPCALCSSETWPCARFQDAAARITARGLRADDVVPAELHPILWPSPTPRPTPAQERYEAAWPKP